MDFREGGPETTAIAIGTVLDAEYVEILTEQDGIYTAESSVVKEARKLKEVTYDEMLELAHLGSTFVHPRAVELAKNMKCRSSFDLAQTMSRGHG